MGFADKDRACRFGELKCRVDPSEAVFEGHFAADPQQEVADFFAVHEASQATWNWLRSFRERHAIGGSEEFRKAFFRAFFDRFGVTALQDCFFDDRHFLFAEDDFPTSGWRVETPCY